MNQGTMKTDMTTRSLPTSLRFKRIMPALLCALLAAPPSWAQTLKAPGAGAGPRLGGTAAPLAPAAEPSTSAPASASSSQRVRPIDAIVAVVNNEVITAQELESRMQTVEARLRSQGGTVPPWPSSSSSCWNA
jgi:peptidyl-prolyl cis-trans isomerase SurA